MAWSHSPEETWYNRGKKEAKEEHQEYETTEQEDQQQDHQRSLLSGRHCRLERQPLRRTHHRDHQLRRHSRQSQQEDGRCVDREWRYVSIGRLHQDRYWRVGASMRKEVYHS